MRYKDSKGAGTERRFAALQVLAVMVGIGMGCAALWAQTSPALQGRVLNGTTSQPVPNVVVEYVLPQQGMAPAGTATTDSEGRFRLERAEPGSGPALLRVEYQGATYTQVVPPPPGRPQEVDIQVFEASRQPGLVTAKEHIIFLEPTGDTLGVVEEVVLENRSNPAKTYVDSDGTYRFTLPEQLREGVRVFVEGPAGMPIQQTPIPKDKPNRFAITYPIRPGQTQVRLEYVLAYQSPSKFSKPLEAPAERTHIVTPGTGVQVQGESLVPEGSEPTSGFLAYRITPVNNQVSLQVSGQAPARASAQGAAAEEASGALVPIPDPVSQRRPWILALLGLVLLGGFIYHYTRQQTG